MTDKSRYTTIIVADSRGRGLEDFIGGHPRPITHEYVIEVLPGKTLQQLEPVAVNHITKYNLRSVYCVIFGGINSLTEKIRHNDRQYLRYPEDSRTRKVESIISIFTNLKERFCDRINFCTIIPASLSKFFQHHNPGDPLPDYIKSEQEALEQDITTINEVIIRLNADDIANIRLDKRVQVRSKKRRQRSGSKIVYRRTTKFNYDNLPDGVHFNNTLKTICFTLIVNTAIYQITENCFRQRPIRQVELESEASSEENNKQTRPAKLRVTVSDSTSDWL